VVGCTAFGPDETLATSVATSGSKKEEGNKKEKEDTKNKPQLAITTVHTLMMLCVLFFHFRGDIACFYNCICPRLQ
jgi:hypothetical protein